jgi:hypothetical protein
LIGQRHAEWGEQSCTDNPVKIHFDRSFNLLDWHATERRYVWDLKGAKIEKRDLPLAHAPTAWHRLKVRQGLTRFLPASFVESQRKVHRCINDKTARYCGIAGAERSTHKHASTTHVI